MADTNQLIRSILLRCNAAVVLGRLRLWLAGGCASAAIAVLAVRVIAPQWNGWLWALLALAPAVAAATWWDARRRFYSRSDALTWLDRRSDAGGLLLAVDATGDRAWRGEAGRKVTACARPLPRWRLGGWVARSAVWVAFLTLALMVPPREVSSNTAQFKTLKGAELARLQSKLEDVQELGLLDEQEQGEIEETIDKLRGDKADAFDQKNWQELDTANRRLDNKLAEANHTLDVARKELDQAADEMQGGQGLSPSTQSELTAALEKLAASSLMNKAPEELKRQLADMNKRAKSGQPPLPSDPAARKQMCENARQFVEQMDQAMQGQGSRNPQNNPGQGRPQPQPGSGMGDFDPGEGSPDVEIDLNDLQPGDGQGGEGGGIPLPGQGQEGGDQPDGDGTPGSGGINRGRGDAPMVWGDESDADGAKFKPNALPPGAILDPESGELIGISRGNPGDEQAGEARTGTGRGFDPTAGGPANRRDYSPAYRGPIGRYYGRKTNEGE